jgi:AAA15 family ATPase/GTPase
VLHTELGDLYLPLNLLGGGDQEVLLLERLLSESGVVYGIEEPETHLHADYQRKLFNKFKSESKNSQMFLTTHSPIFVDRIDFDNSSIWLVTKEKKMTEVERVNVEDGQNLKDEVSFIIHISTQCGHSCVRIPTRRAGRESVSGIFLFP